MTLEKFSVIISKIFSKNLNHGYLGDFNSWLSKRFFICNHLRDFIRNYLRDFIREYLNDFNSLLFKRFNSLYFQRRFYVIDC